MALGRRKMDTESFGSVDSRPLVMAYNTSGWTPAASKNQMKQNSRRLSTLCSAGTTTRLDATFICRMFRQLSGKQRTA